MKPRTMPVDDLPHGPLAQSAWIGFGVLRIGVALLAMAWATGNIRPIPPGTQAVILRFGQVARVRQAGLVLAWPRPIEDVARLPAGERQMELKIAARTARAPGIVDEVSSPADIPDAAGAYLTGDGGLILLDASITWRIADAGAYYLAADHVAPALRRMFLDSTIAVAAGRPLDDFLAVRATAESDAAAAAARATMRGALVATMNRDLAALTESGGGLGVEVTRADVTPLLPPAAKQAFDAVLEATQRADEGLAGARTDAARIAQQGDRDRDRVLAQAQAQAAERTGDASKRVAAIAALAQSGEPSHRPALLDRLYRDGIAGVLRQAGRVTTLDPRGVGRVLLQGPAP